MHNKGMTGKKRQCCVESCLKLCHSIDVFNFVYACLPIIVSENEIMLTKSMVKFAGKYDGDDKKVIGNVYIAVIHLCLVEPTDVVSEKVSHVCHVGLSYR